MSPLSRPLAAPMMSFDLGAQVAELRSDDAYGRTGRVGRTLAKSGRMRLVLVVVRRGVDIGTHHAEGPMTVHVLEGGITFRVQGRDHDLGAGEVLFFGPGDAHDIRALDETALLLTLSVIGEQYDDGAR